MDADGKTVVTLVIESQCVRLAELAADVSRDPAMVCKMGGRRGYVWEYSKLWFFC